MGVVDLGRRADGTEVALKRLTLHGSTEDIARARQRIEREAEVLTRLDHPNIVELLEVLDDGDEVTLVMAYLTGGTLAERVAKHGPVPADEVERLADALGSALAEAHRAGVVHRDIKPGNVLFDAHGVPHLADFGVASSRDDTAGLTVIGTVVGTPGFMAPEQARGEGAGQASDVFALGATLLYAATGEGPYGRGAAELLMVRAAQGKVRPIPRSLPASLRQRLEAMLDPRPEKRPSAAALVGGPAGTEVRTPVTRPPSSLAGVGRRRRRWRSPRCWPAVAGRRPARRASRRHHRRTVDDDRVHGPAVPAVRRGRTRRRAPTARRCLAGFEDYDADAANGCEAADDGLADDTRSPRAPTDRGHDRPARRRRHLRHGRRRRLAAAVRRSLHGADHRAGGHDAAPRGARRRREVLGRDHQRRRRARAR